MSDITELNNDEWEEIDPQEVETVLAALDSLAENTKSENIANYLHTAYAAIEALVEWEDETGEAEAA